VLSPKKFKQMMQAAKKSGECRMSRTTAVLFLIMYGDHLDELPVWVMVKGYDNDNSDHYVGLQSGDVDVDFLKEVAFGSQYTRFALWRHQ
jgi:hypothetical protein